MRNIIKLITVLLIIFVLSIFYISLNRNTNYDTEYLVGNKLAEIKLKDFDKDTFYTENDFKNNKYTLINFWASWCGPCRVEHPVLMELSKEKNLRIFGVNFKDSKNNATKFLDNLGNPYYQIAGDQDGKQSIRFGIYGIPESILVNSELIILKKYIGPLNLDDLNEIKKLMKSL